MAVGEQIPRQRFQIREREDPNGRVRLVLFGHLDDRSARELASRLDSLTPSRRPACLDLSKLAWIEPGAAARILAVVGAARQVGWKLELVFV